ncbi:biopolymer transporter ExbD [uncultured Rhodoferax sp.]|uniref:ExbD/TolR family protein n=1 Tax=uncultured Rhodoferax sp. TaxID=223188 RepID=UPI0025CCCD6E|nr:biopolymer transporter ExbD [uncultured Rhodoferax sp.]
MSFGRLERTQGAQPMSEINMTPLIDVMLVLLVIFIITAPLMVSAVKLDLPKAEGAQALEGAPSVALALDTSGQVYLADQPIALPALAEALRNAAAKNPQTEVQLRADSTVPYGKVVELMGLAHAAGLSRIGFVAQAEPAPPAPTP